MCQTCELRLRRKVCRASRARNADGNNQKQPSQAICTRPASTRGIHRLISNRPHVKRQVQVLHPYHTALRCDIELEFSARAHRSIPPSLSSWSVQPASRRSRGKKPARLSASRVWPALLSSRAVYPARFKSPRVAPASLRCVRGSQHLWQPLSSPDA